MNEKSPDEIALMFFQLGLELGRTQQILDEPPQNAPLSLEQAWQTWRTETGGIQE